MPQIIANQHHLGGEYTIVEIRWLNEYEFISLNIRKPHKVGNKALQTKELKKKKNALYSTYYGDRMGGNRWR